MKTILVIDDNDAVRSEVVDILRFEGYRVVEAADGRGGIERVKEAAPDLVICDLMMPLLDGYGVLDAVRSEPAWATLPFVFLTARTDRAGVRRGMEHGADDYLTKPFTAEELLRAVTAALEKKVRTDRESQEKLEELRGQISMSLPHELRTPLNIIMGYAELLSDPSDTREAGEVTELARNILGAAQRLNRLTENFLLYAQLELLASRDERRALVGPGTRVDSAVAGVARARARGAEREGDLVLDLRPATAAIEEGALVKIVDEILDNAVKFSISGTPVGMTTSAAADAVVLAVSDRGRAMTAAQVAAVGGYLQFDRARREQQGIGLGLSIAQGMVHLWGGALAIESLPGRGTTVSVTLPAATEAQRAAATTPPRRADAGAAPRASER